MIEIGQIRIKLPPGFENRAASIGHLIGDELAKIKFRGQVEIESIRLPALKIAKSAGDFDVARTVVEAIMKEINGELKDK